MIRVYGIVDRQPVDMFLWCCSDPTIRKINFVYYGYTWVPSLSDRLKWKYLLRRGD